MAAFQQQKGVIQEYCYNRGKATIKHEIRISFDMNHGPRRPDIVIHIKPSEYGSEADAFAQGFKTCMKLVDGFDDYVKIESKRIGF